MKKCLLLTNLLLPLSAIACMSHPWNQMTHFPVIDNYPLTTFTCGVVRCRTEAGSSYDPCCDYTDPLGHYDPVSPDNPYGECLPVPRYDLPKIPSGGGVKVPAHPCLLVGYDQWIVGCCITSSSEGVDDPLMIGADNHIAYENQTYPAPYDKKPMLPGWTLHTNIEMNNSYYLCNSDTCRGYDWRAGN